MPSEEITPAKVDLIDRLPILGNEVAHAAEKLASGLESASDDTRGLVERKLMAALTALEESPAEEAEKILTWTTDEASKVAFIQENWQSISAEALFKVKVALQNERLPENERSENIVEPRYEGATDSLERETTIYLKMKTQDMSIEAIVDSLASEEVSVPFKEEIARELRSRLHYDAAQSEIELSSIDTRENPKLQQTVEEIYQWIREQTGPDQVQMMPVVDIDEAKTDETL